MKRGVLSCMFCALLLFGGGAAGQYLRHFNTHQLLRASAVYHTLRDRAGFLWFCTDQGLARYDGHTVTRFTQADGLPDNMVFNAYEDPHGRIWAFCYNGKYGFIYRDKVHNENNDRLLASLPHSGSYITYMRASADSGLYMGFLNHSVLHIYGQKAHWDHRNEKPAGGLDISAGKISYSPSAATGIFVPTGGDSVLLSDYDGLKITVKGRLVWRLDDPSLTQHTVTDICPGDSGRLLISTNHGLVILSLAGNLRSKLLEGQRITGCTQDIAGNFWISTAGNGLYQMHRELSGIRQLHEAEGCEWIQLGNGRLVFLKDNALYQFDGSGDGIRPQRIKTGIPNYYDPVLLTDKLVAFYDNWTKRSVVQLRSGGTVFNDNFFFKRIYEHKDSLFFICGKSSVYRYRLSGGRFTVYAPAVPHSAKISVSCQDPGSGTVYYIAGDSLFSYSFPAGKLTAVLASPGFSDAEAIMARQGMIRIAAGKTGYCLIQTSAGSPRLSWYRTPFPAYTIVPGKGSGCILQSDEGSYLIPSAGDQPRIIDYPFSSSSAEHFYISGKYAILRLDDRCYYFDTALLNKKPQPLSVYLQKVTVNGKDYEGRDIRITNTVSADVQVSVGILDFSRNLHRLRYRIRGPEGSGQWNSVGTPNIALSLQKAGSYKIELLPESAPATAVPLLISLQIIPPFYRSDAFYISLSFALAALAVLGFLFVLRKRRSHFQQELNYLKLEHRAINALLNPHFVFNSINNIQSLIHREEKTNAAEYLAILSRLIRQNLENLKLNLVPLADELSLIERYVHLQNLRYSGNIEIFIACDEGLEKIEIQPLLLQPFVENAILHGYSTGRGRLTVSITASRQNEDYVCINIRDNGIGLKAAAERISAVHKGKSMGIAFNRRRLERLSQFYGLRQSLTVREIPDAEGGGTEVILIVYARFGEVLSRKKELQH